MISGKGEKSLIRELNKIEECTTVDSLIKNGQRIIIEATREKGKIGPCIIQDARRKQIAEGKTYGSLVEKLTGNTTAMGFGGEVLCYWKANGVRRYDGKIKSTWIVIHPGVPCFEDENGLPEFDTIDLTLTQKEYDKMRETSLAFYEDDVIYSISQESLLSLGNFLDCSALFSSIDKDRFMLGIAIEIGEKLSVHRSKIDLLCEKTRNKNFKIVKSLVGNKYEKKCFILDALDYLARFGQFEVTEWTKSDYDITCKLKKFSEDLTVNQWLVLTSGTVSGVPSTVTAYAAVDGFAYPLHIVSKPKRINTPIESYFEGMIEAFDSFDPQKTLMIKESDVMNIATAVGSGRWNTVCEKTSVNVDAGEKPLTVGYITLQDFVSEMQPVYKSVDKSDEHAKHVFTKLQKIMQEINARG